MATISFLKGTLFCASLFAATGQVSARIQETHPAVIVEHTMGSRIVVGGEEMFVVGYFGARKSTVQELDLDREIYYGDLQTAQGYADGRSGEGRRAVGATALLVSRLSPHGFHGSPRFDEFMPLVAGAGHKIELKIAHIDEVNADTRVGLLGALGRCHPRTDGVVRSGLLFDALARGVTNHS